MEKIMYDSDEVMIRIAEGDGTASEWIARCPDKAEEIAHFAAENWIDKRLGDDEPAIPSRLAEMMAANFRRAREAALSAAPALESLTSAAKAAGLTPKQAAARLGLKGVAVFTKLEQRLIAFSSVPEKFVAALAETIGRGADEVSAYLRQGPILAPSASYRSPGKPGIGKVQSFAEALEGDEEAARRWLGEGEA